MLQRIGLAQALIGRPKVLFLDEPTSGMDPEGATATREMVQAFARQGGTVLINSHQLEQVARACDRVAFFRQGELVETRELRHRGAGKLWRYSWMKNAASRSLKRAGLEKLFGRAGAVLKELRGLEARVIVDGNEAAAKALQALMRQGLQVLQSGPHQEDLEAMFAEEEP
jgi:ABC-2 type transport system ATP-binding protein